MHIVLGLRLVITLFTLNNIENGVLQYQRIGLGNKARAIYVYIENDSMQQEFAI